MTPAELLGASLPDLLAAAGAVRDKAHALHLAEAPEDRYPAASEWLVAIGYRSPADDLACFMDAL